ncbi:hypothetical protein CPB86DRAFT_698784 [Serendipita vermifera]|nr:hypothetical protein CPB86DRAFT_698784 [Serendipita vermifera]
MESCQPVLKKALFILAYFNLAKPILGCDDLQPLLGQPHADQQVLNPSGEFPRPNIWRLELEDVWDVLGPFPQHAREQHFKAPSYPVNLSQSWDAILTEEYPSSLVNGGVVGWTRRKMSDGTLLVEFPEAPWKQLRATEGWAILQHHALLHTRLRISPPSSAHQEVQVPTYIKANIRQASFFAIIPQNQSSDYTPKWHNGNIYDLSNSPDQIIELPHSPDTNEVTIYHLIVSADSEIRLFGDPLDVDGQEDPIQRVMVDFSIPQTSLELSLSTNPQLSVAPDFVDGWALSDGAIGIGVISYEGWWEVASLHINTNAFNATNKHLPMRIAPSQTVIIPVSFGQNDTYFNAAIPISIELCRIDTPRIELDCTHRITLDINVPIVHKSSWWDKKTEPIYKVTYFLGQTPLYYMVKPPKQPSLSSPAIVALHGAGVEAAEPVWTGSVPQRDESWVIFPTGRTTWGFDWHGPSALDVWGSAESFYWILQNQGDWKAWSFDRHGVILIGHSNGGQGTWYLAERYPDKVLAAIPAAAYIKSQLYIPLHHSHGSHFIDAQLKWILESALSPDDNDILASNLVKTPILSIHGGSDQNVPTWHSRELVSVVKSWYPDANISFHEEPGAPHWWNSVLASSKIRSFLDDIISSSQDPYNKCKDFVLSIAIPEESGSLCGIKIEEITVPGRLGRIYTQISSQNEAMIQTNNVQQFALSPKPLQHINRVTIDGNSFSISSGDDIKVFRRIGGSWRESDQLTPLRPSGPLHRILSTEKPLIIIVPKTSESGLTLASRLAHNLVTYLRIDTQILYDNEAISQLQKDILDCSNLIVIGGYHNNFGQYILSGNPSPVRFTQDGWKLASRSYESPGLGAMFLHSHPFCSTALSLFMAYTDEQGLERIFRLFPLRTGVMVPEWIVTGPKADSLAAGGLLGAGYWGRSWEWNEHASWLGFN